MNEHRLMNGGSRIAVAELSLNENTTGVLKIKVFRRALPQGDTACIRLARVPFLDAAELNSGSREHSSASSGK